MGLGSELIDTDDKAPELVGFVVSKLLSEKASVQKEDIIYALKCLAQESGDWRMRADCGVA